MLIENKNKWKNIYVENYLGLSAGNSGRSNEYTKERFSTL